MQTIINELYKTNLKFRTTCGAIEILNDRFIPIATIKPVVEAKEPTPSVNHKLQDYLIAKGEIIDPNL